MKLVLASANRGKLAEFQRALEDLPLALVSAQDAGVTRFPEEVGGSYEENAFHKAAFVAARTRLPALGDDSGLEVAALGGGPGLYSARYGGALSDLERCAHLLAALRGVPEAERSARFVCAIVLATPQGEVTSFEGMCEGRILEGPRGTGGFGYDPVFFSPELGATFAEASAERKARVSHRARAVAALRLWLEANLAPQP